MENKEILILTKNIELSNTILIQSQYNVDNQFPLVIKPDKVARVIQLGDVFEIEEFAGYLVEIISVVGPNLMHMDDFIIHNGKNLYKMGYLMMSQARKDGRLIKDLFRIKELKEEEK